MKKPTLDIILVNRNSGDLLRDCLESLVRANKDGFELQRVCVVDDCSTDQSLNALETLDLPLEIVRNTARLGYGASCNRGAQDGTSDYILFLNTDIILSPRALASPVQMMMDRRNSDVGILGIKLIEDSGEVARCCSRFPKLGMFLTQMFKFDVLFPRKFKGLLMSDWDHLDTRDVDQVMGAFMLIRREVFNQIEGFSKDYFVYMEDLDLSLRAKRHGWRSLYFADVDAWHKRGGTARKVWAESLFFNLESRLKYAFNHFGTLQGVVLTAATLLVEPVCRIGFCLISRRRHDIGATVVAYSRLWRRIVGNPRLFLKKCATRSSSGIAVAGHGQGPVGNTP